MMHARLLKSATAWLLSGAMLASTASYAQVPVIDGARLTIQKTTQQWYDQYQKNQRTTRGNAGDTTNSFAPGQGTGGMDCSSFGGGNGWGGQVGPNNPRNASQEQVRQMVAEEARRQGVDPNFAMAIAEQESRFRQSAVSPVGARGVMQLMPGTAKQLGVNSYDMRDNIRGGVKYLKQIMAMYPGRLDLVAAGYNAGPHRQSLRNGKIPPFKETQDYVRKVSGYYERNKQQNGDQTPTGNPTPETVSAEAGCGEALKEAMDRNTEAQVARGQEWNALVGKSLELNKLKQQSMLDQLKGASASLRSSGAGSDDNRFGDGSGEIAMHEIQCPSSVVNTGSTRCYAVPPNASSADVGRMLAYLQEQARIQGLESSFAAIEDNVVGLVTVVDSRRTQ
ncbi:lytic transglycosylase domain-containing protein [Aminobacter sp. MET-1]|uniref:lytic transglycosylase domain-containing protein n=1 Tax=Aminobacter sp. MET-1 TaxID=2951085 RepID=UPI00226A7266|nr:lytic transglycosylase domain-containing protein [Aminobacter sp. MET-1]MCX8571130.1 lytic transglycosylase domain-containing protein [Aminobacter sp. MET-1]MCX8573201.1 lytic transglycosylase domain-containing protein [Aminobacter sp. MET-1]